MRGLYIEKTGEVKSQNGTTILYNCDLFYPEMYYAYILQFLRKELNEEIKVCFTKGSEIIKLDNNTKVNTQNIDQTLVSIVSICKEKDVGVYVRFDRKDKPHFSVHYHYNVLGFNVFVASKKREDVAEVEKLITRTVRDMYNCSLPFLPTRYLALKQAKALDKASPHLKAACLEYIRNIDKYWELEAVKAIINKQKQACEQNGYCQEYTKEFLLSLQKELEEK